MDSVFLFSLLVYFAVVIAIGYWTSRNESRLGFLLADRDVSIFNLGFSFGAGWFGGGVLVLFTSMGYGGLITFAAFVGAVIVGLIGSRVMVNRLQDYSVKTNSFTSADVMHSYFGLRCGLLTAVISTIVFFGAIVVQFMVGASLLAEGVGISYQAAVISLSIVTALYLIMGGLKAVLKTDILQYVLIIVLAGLFFAFNTGTFSFGEIQDMVVGDESLRGMGNWLYGATDFILILPAIFFAMDVWQRIFAAGNYKNAANGMVFGAVLFTILASCFAVVGMYVKTAAPDLAPDNAAMYAFTEMMPQAFSALVMVLLFALIMSTLDSYMFIAAQSLANDGLARFGWLGKFREDHPRLTLRVGIFVVTALAVLAALFLDQSVVTIYLYAIYFYAAMTPLCLRFLLDGKAFKGMDKKARETAVFYSTVFAMAANIWAMMTYTYPGFAILAITVIATALMVVIEKLCTGK